MKPVSEAYNMDCMEYMKTIPDKWFDLAIVDPPYGINIANRNGSIGKKKGQGKITKYSRKDWDSTPPPKEYFYELFRVSQNQIIFGANYFTNFLPPSKGWIVWNKRQPEGVTFAMAELAFTSIDKSIKMFSCSRALVKNCVSNNDKLARMYAKIHPAQKPIALYAWILKNYAKQGDRIFDSHLGSGSSRIVAYKLGFDFYATEIDKDYFDAQEERFRKECFGEIKLSNNTIVKQTQLFDEQ